MNPNIVNKAILLFLTLSLQFAKAQTPNNNMANAELLQLNQFINSKTHGNTVEWDCVDESLTGKCIDYHNDQWFRFYSDSLSTIFINISGQQCRDMRGVQLVVLKGERCQPGTYEILDCISLATQDDIYTKVDVQPETYYWLNIDGYLHDFCEFFIEVSNEPKGISIDTYELTRSDLAREKNIVGLKWQVPDSLQYKILNTHIFRKINTAFKYDLRANIELQQNAFGELQNEYFFADTLLLPGNYQYRLVFEFQNGEQQIFAEYSAVVPGRFATISSGIITLEFDYDRRSPLTIKFRDVDSGEVLHQESTMYNPGRANSFSFYENYFDVSALEVTVTHEYSGYEKSYYFSLKN